MADTPQLRGMIKVAAVEVVDHLVEVRSREVLMARLDPEEIGLHSLRPKHGLAQGPQAPRRGKGSGTGKTAGRGHKGYGARSGSKRKVAYEGGQNPILMRMRKMRGAEQEAVDAVRAVSHPHPAGQRLRPRGPLRRRRRGHARDAARPRASPPRKHPVKVLGRGEISTKLTVRAHAFSGSAKEKIEAAGGTAEVIEGKLGARASDDRQRLQRPGDPPEDRLHGGDPGCSTGSARTSRRRASTSTRSSPSRTTSPATTSSAS